jgi:hypothetical protein
MMTYYIAYRSHVPFGEAQPQYDNSIYLLDAPAITYLSQY